MKRVIAIFLLAVLLTGCAGGGDMDRAMAFRAKLLAGQGVSFDTKITADYGDKFYTFAVHCETDAQGNLTFAVREPETIAGITGSVTQGNGKLTFDGNALAFDTMADGQLSPVSGPWVLMKSLRSGYLTSCAEEGENLRLAVDDSYADDALHLDVWLDAADLPIRGEIFWQGRRILSMDIENFTIL